MARASRSRFFSSFGPRGECSAVGATRTTSGEGTKICTEHACSVLVYVLSVNLCVHARVAQALSTSAP